MEAEAAVPVDFQGGAPFGEVLVPESIAGSANGSEHGAELGNGNGGSIDGSAADDEPAGAAPLLEPDSEDDDDPSVDEEITNAMTATGMTEVFTLALPAMCNLLNVTHLTTPLFGNQVIKVGDDVTTFILTGGAARVRAAAAYADSLEGTGKVPAKLGMASLASAMYAMVEVLFDPASEAPVRHAVEREGSPETGFIRKALAVARAVKDTTSSAKEFSSAEMERLALSVAPLLGHDFNGVADLAAPAQTKIISKEINAKTIPSSASVQPQVIWRSGGDLGVAAPKAEKNKELVAEATTCTLQLRGRWSTLCITEAACIMDMVDRDGVTSNREAALAALGMATALKNAHHLICFADVNSALEDAVDAARSVQNVAVHKRGGFAAAFNAGSRAIGEANRSARRDASKANASADSGPLTMKDLREQLQQALKAKPNAPKGKTGGASNPSEKKNMKPAKLATGKTEFFERKRGGNPACPVKCTKAHTKDTWCHLDHSDK